ncbi:enoyl-CoA hydratase-related protein [Dictyobacter aurantiacus]|uniref:Enoyl-CoA hydratase n=1 Tax=Dictyobacter aurantiacus TaxID=1936993 RepID=A0A401ZI41_9CHLR|nr:enoyl-CoA hydratase-related protein [Dictyobacter aurantiacus]GCE06510.1 enoyl-CoA hydratase [Dictyobacter aurantiacus]
MVITQHQEAGLLTLTLNRPDALNAITTELLVELGHALEKAQDPAVRTVLLTGAGRAFSVGQDLKEVQVRQESFKDHLRHYNRVIKLLQQLEKPVLAAINGAAAGAGFSLTLACDLRLASEGSFVTPAFSRIGLVPDSGMSYFLPRIVGWSKAFDMLTFSPRITAEEAFEMGIVDRIFPADTFQEQVRAFAMELAQGPTLAIGLTKQLLRRSGSSSLDEMLDLEAQMQDRAGQSQDHQEGLKAFMEKRGARFSGF